MRHTLKKEEILRGYGSFQDVLSRGQKLDGAILACSYTTHHASEDDRRVAFVGFAVSNKVRGSVRRNRCKRLMRESYRRLKCRLVDELGRNNMAMSVVFTAKNVVSRMKTLPKFNQIYDEMYGLMERILDDSVR